jgi:hypothetical protein
VRAPEPFEDISIGLFGILKKELGGKGITHRPIIYIGEEGFRELYELLEIFFLFDEKAL